MKLIFFSFFLLFVTQSFAKEYFQQEVFYEIHVSLDDVKHELTANETIRYVNHSPDTLRELYFHLWPNAYKNNMTALAEQFYQKGKGEFSKAREEDFGGIEELNFNVDGESVQWELLPDTIDICRIHLKKSLAPNESITITTPFKVKIPSGEISRMGHLKQAYFITQWFPKPAVYDARGWNYFSYLNQGEFYSEFGTFDIYITLPVNYVVGATGDLVDGEKELEWLDNKIKETKYLLDSITHNPKLITHNSHPDMSFPKSDTALKTLHYHAENVHDFAWFTDKRWHVLKGETTLPESNRKVTTWARFTNAEAEYWKNSIGYINDAVLYYSKWVGEYPYNQASAVDVTDAAGGGMEYPMITAIGNYGSAFDLEATISHEVGHNWFYAILGSNERLHPWMDEGMNQFYETRYVYTKYANDSAKQQEETGRLGVFGKIFGLTRFNHRTLQYLQYQYGARKNTDQQPDMHSPDFTRSNYPADVYRKTALSFDFLKSYLGDSMFDLCMHDYFNQWKFKHPMPEDVKESFEKVSGEKLSWLFSNLLQSDDKIDYKISSIKTGGQSAVRIKNAGTVDSPFSLSSMKNKKVISTKWYPGFYGSKTFQLNCTDCDAIKIDAEEKIPDIDRKNNTIRTSGMFKKVEPLKIQWPASLEDPGHTQLFFTPAAGWNNYNKWMLGGAVYNLSVPEKKFEYLLMPLYSPASKQLVGGGRLNYNIYVHHALLNKINISTGYSGYAFEYAPYFSDNLNFQKISSAITFSFMNKKHSAEQYHSVVLRNIWTEYEQPAYTSSYELEIKQISRLFNFVDYQTGNSSRFNPYQFLFSTGITPGLVLGSFEFSQTLSYKEKGRGFEYRVYSGFRGETGNSQSISSGSFDFNLHMSGQGGRNDYLFDEVFFGRSERTGLLSQQFTATQGGFKVLTYTGVSEVWLAALNLKTPFPGKIPLYLFADIGTYSIPERTPDFLRKSLMFDYGIELRIIPKILSVYFPLGYSSDIKKIYELNEARFEEYTQKIRFELNLSKLNPFTLRNSLNF